MHDFSWLDNRTLVVCDFMLAVAFAIVFFGLKRTYPNLRGVNTIAVSFLLFVPGTTLVIARGAAPDFISVMLSNCCVFGSFVFLYRGILRFIGSRRSSIVPVVVSCIALGILFYCSQIQDRFVPRILAISLTVGLIRGMIALELFRKSPSSPSPRAMRFFAACMSLFAAFAVNGGIATILSTTRYIRPSISNFNSMAMLLSVVSIFVTGIFILLLSSCELIATSRDESQKDSLSGAFNRRGIEIKLATEIMGLRGGKHKLSIALIDIDHFKSINDAHGHAAGDTALRSVAETISRHLRGRDYLGRYGGDEFLLILPQTPGSIAVGVTDRLCRAVANLATSGTAVPFTLSVGLTEAVAEDDATSLLARADKALYQAKSDGRNCRRIVLADKENEHSATSACADILISGAESSPVR